MLKVVDHSNLYRDPASKAIINTDEAGYDAYIKKRNGIKEKNNQISQNTEAIAELKEDINEIKKMLMILLSK